MYDSWEETYIHMYVCVWGRRSPEKRKEKRREEWKEKLIHTDKQIEKQPDVQIDTNHSLIWDTTLNNLVNQIRLE